MQGEKSTKGKKVKVKAVFALLSWLEKEGNRQVSNGVLERTTNTDYTSKAPRVPSD
jgi:hypothetical protein